MNRLIRTIAIIGCVMTFNHIDGQHILSEPVGDPRTSFEESMESFLEANTRGLAILSKARQVHGDITDSSLKIALTVEAKHGIHRGQSLVVEPPYERYHLENMFYIDRKKGIEVGHFMNRFAGFNFENIIIINDAGSRDYNLLTKEFIEASSSGFENFRYFPHRYIKAAIAQPRHLYAESVVNYKGKPVNRVIVGGGTAVQRMYFDAENGYLLRIEYLRNYQPYGDGVSFKEFSDFEKFGSLTLPQTIHTGGDYGAWGLAVNRFELSEIDHALMRTSHDQMVEFSPADYHQVAKNQLTEVADDIYLIENITESTTGDDYNVLFAVYNDFVLVGEAPVNTDVSEKVLQHIRSIADKPIKYLVQSHHHNDHWGGIRTYMAERASIVTTVGNEAMLRKIASAPFAMHPDRQWKDPKPLALKLVKGSIEVTDKNHTAIIYDVGPTNHAKEMLIIYFPKHGLLWQADLISYGEWDLNDPRSDHLLDMIKSLDLNVNVIVGVHGKIFEGKALQEWLNQ